jgi:3'(2'), 5'-bisphosphate nucleotidase
MEWDTAAGQIICKEAGYDIVDIETNLPIQYNRKKLTNNSFIAS